MRKFCVVPMSQRTGSTYLVRFIKKYNDCCYLNEFLKVEYIYRPFENEYPAFNMSPDIPDMELLTYIKKGRLKEFNSIIEKNWRPDWFTMDLLLDDDMNVIIRRKQRPNFDDVNTLLKHNIDVITKTKQSIVFKLYPQWFQKHDIINIDIIKGIQKDVHLIYLKRRNILDSCLSAIIANSTGFFTFLYDTQKKYLDKKFNFNPIIVNEIFDGILQFEKVKKDLTNIKSTTLYYEDLFNDENLLNELNLLKEDKNDFILPKKLYPSQSFEEKLSFIENVDEFYNEYNKGMKMLKQQGIEI